MAAVGYTLIAIACGGILILALRPDVNGAWRTAIENRPIVITGKYSYALYLFHMPIAEVTDRGFSRFGVWDTGMGYGVAYAGYFAMTLLTSYALAFLSWNFFEKPILRLKRHFSHT
jgi:peptidoglycan/LPS O-acetylase OafA/YrhL